jgi:hypothetical protein
VFGGGGHKTRLIQLIPFLCFCRGGTGTPALYRWAIPETAGSCPALPFDATLNFCDISRHKCPNRSVTGLPYPCTQTPRNVRIKSPGAVKHRLQAISIFRRSAQMQHLSLPTGSRCRSQIAGRIALHHILPCFAHG